MKKHVFIIGAGTAGLILARELSRRGIETTVFDQKRKPGTPVTASGIISINGLKSIKTEYESAVTNILYGARLHAGKSVMNIKAKKPIAFVVDREKFSNILISEAKEAGTELLLGKRISENEIELLSKEGILVGADGAVSTVAKHFNMGNVESYVLTYKAEYETILDDTQSVDLFFDKEISAGLFGWLCPNSKSILEVGIGINPGKYNSRAAFQKFISNNNIDNKLKNTTLLNEHASIIPMKLRKKIVDEKNNVILVGDSAGQVKPSTGGGIVFGGNAAIIAAEIIQKHLQNKTSLKEYEKLYKKKFVFDTKVHKLLNNFYSNASEKSLSLTMRVLNNIGMSSFLSEYGDMDSPKTMIKNAILRKRI
ncbi:MAG: NAD(P)/FAD-dependent oxidoreductase [Candidatus Micrarchaeaceae archaeon]